MQMVATKVLFGKEAQDKLIEGIELVHNAVSSTLGPGGRCVPIMVSNALNFKISKDGVSVAKCISSRDAAVNVGVRLIKHAAETAGRVGDGTTTATVLAYSLIREAQKYIVPGTNVNSLTEGIDLELTRVLNYLDDKKVKIDISSSMLDHVAAVSCNGDIKSSSIVVEAIRFAGEDGSVVVEKCPEYQHTQIKKVEGMKFAKGLFSSNFVNTPESGEAVYEDGIILVTDKSIVSKNSLMPLLRELAGSNTPVAIVCPKLSGEALEFLSFNRLKSNLPVAAILAPGIEGSEHQKEILKDIAAYTGGTFISSETGYSSIETVKISNLGKFRKIVSSRGDHPETTILGTTDSTIQAVRDDRILLLKSQKEAATNTFDKERFAERIGCLSSGIAVIQVGAKTEQEIPEIKDRIDDALCSVRSALRDGVLPGGGSSLISAKSSLGKPSDSDRDVESGKMVLWNALESPLRVIMANVGISFDEYKKDLQSCDFGLGYNAKSKKMSNLIEDGVMDSFGVVSSSLKAAVSTATLILKSSALICPDIDISGIEG